MNEYQGRKRTGFAKEPGTLDLDGDSTVQEDKGAQHCRDDIKLADVEDRHLKCAYADSRWKGEDEVAILDRLEEVLPRILRGVPSVFFSRGARLCEMDLKGGCSRRHGIR